MADVTVEEEINRMDELVENIQYLQEHSIAIGIFEDEKGGETHSEGEMTILGIARVHEYGVTIEVTEKMRAYLHATGLHLREDTDQIEIPERSFIRAGFDANKDYLNKRANILINHVLEGGMDAETALETLGEQIRTRLQAYLGELSDPPLRDYSIEQRAQGGSNPLVDTGRLQGAIEYKVV